MTSTAIGAAGPRTSVTPARGAQRAIVVCDQWLGSDGYAGMKALRRAGWNVLVTPEWDFVPVHWRTFPMRVIGKLLRPAAVREFNDALVDQARQFSPEMLLVFKGMFVRADALRRFRALGIRTYCFYPDVSFLAHGPQIPRALPEYDWVFTTKTFGIGDMREQLGVTRASLIHFAYDPDLHRPVSLTASDRARFECDVSYIGTWSTKKESLLSNLLSCRPHLRLRIWGSQWQRSRSPALVKAIAGHHILGEDFVRAVRGSRINLSIMSEARQGSSKGDQVASRTFSVPACEAFVLHERTEEVLTFFREPEEIVCYGSFDELVAMIDQYLPDDRARAAVTARAREVVRVGHSWDVRILHILQRHWALRT